MKKEIKEFYTYREYCGLDQQGESADRLPDDLMWIDDGTRARKLTKGQTLLRTIKNNRYEEFVIDR